MALVDVSLLVLATAARAGATSFLSHPACCHSFPTTCSTLRAELAGGLVTGMPGSCRTYRRFWLDRGKPDDRTERCRLRSATSSAIAPSMALAAVRAAAVADRNHRLRNYSIRKCRLHTVRPARTSESAKAGRTELPFGG